LGHRWAEQGFYVSILAADEGADGLLMRVGQSLGLDRDALENGEGDTGEELAAHLEALPAFMLVDAGEEQATVEDAACELQARAAGRPAVLLIDSIQTVRASGTGDAADPRARVDAVMATLKGVARGGVLVVATCELNRGAYRSRRPEDRVEDLAAFKESGGVEYGAHLAIVLRSVQGQIGAVDVSMAKNRWGQRLPVRLALDFDRATFREVAIPAEEARELELDPGAALELDMEAVRKVLRGNPGIAGKDKLCSMLRGISKTRARAAVRSLEQSGEIENQGTLKRPVLHLRPVPEKSPHSPDPPESPGGLANLQPAAPAPPFRGAGSGAGLADGVSQ
jgi:hypothetical protein